MKKNIKNQVSDKDEFIIGIKEFKKHAKRDSMYKVAKFLISQFWRNCPRDIDDGLSVCCY